MKSDISKKGKKEYVSLKRLRKNLLEICKIQWQREMPQSTPLNRSHKLFLKMWSQEMLTGLRLRQILTLNQDFKLTGQLVKSTLP
jgi:hypothetical protein